MTSTSFNTGYSLQRNSSKVIQPPGGQTADIFGGRTELSYSSASSQDGSDVVSSRVHLEADQQSIGGQSGISSNQMCPMDGMVKQTGAFNGQVSPNGSVNSGASGQPQLLMADDYKPIVQQLVHQMPQANQNLQLQQQQRLLFQQQQCANRTPKKTIPVIRRNPITGEIYEQPASRQQPVVRVRQPPGGRSSGIF